MAKDASNGSTQYQVGDLTLNIGQRQVRKGDESLQLGGLTFDLLHVLVESAPNVVSHDELAEKVWSGRPVSPETITQRAMMLRQALDDSAESPRYFEVVRGHGFRLIVDVVASTSEDKPSLRPASVALVGGLAIVAAAILALFQFMPGNQNNLLPNSVAVLPFDNLSPDPDNAYIAAGIHDTIVNELAKITDMNVIARTSMLRYGDGQTPVSQIAEELNVETVMAGTVQYADGQVRITAQLIDPETGSHLWTESYDRDFADIFAIQSEIAEQITMALEVQLLPSELESIERPYTNSPEAYALFLKARAMWESSFFGMGGVRDSIEANLDQAVRLDAKFALAYAWKAILYAGGGESNEDKVVQNARRALDLDPSLGIAHAALGDYYQRNWRGQEARDSFERATALSPNNEVILGFHIGFLNHANESDQAIRLANQRIELAPSSQSAIASLTMAHWFGGNLDLAGDAARREIEINPISPGGYFRLAGIELAKGNTDLALEYIRKSDQYRSSGEGTGSMNLAYTYRLAGSLDDARRILSERQDRFTDDWEYGLAIGDYDLARRALRESIQKRETLYGPYWLTKMNARGDPELDKLAWRELREEMGF